MTHGYLASSRPNRTRQAILAIAYIMMVVLTIAAMFPASAGDSPQTWLAAAQPELPQFTSDLADHNAEVGIDPESQSLQTLTRADILAGMRTLHRGGAYHTDTILRIAKRARGYAAIPAIMDELEVVLRKHTPWSADEIQTLKAVLSEHYLHIVH